LICNHIERGRFKNGFNPCSGPAFSRGKGASSAAHLKMREPSTIVALTVKEILDEHIDKKLASNKPNTP
jgi:hypothetical protein